MESVVFTFSLFVLSSNVNFGLGQFSFEPPDYIVALQGDTVLLPCGVSSYITATLSWQERNTGQILTKGPHVDPEYSLLRTSRSRISIIGDRSNGEYNLQIRYIEGSDAGRYACHFYDETRRQDYYSNSVTLNVFTAPDRGFPKCSMTPSFARFGIGEAITLTCKSQGGNPPAALSWLKGNVLIKEKITPKGYPNIHNLTITLTGRDVDQKYTCVAYNPVNRQRPSSCFVKPLRSALGVSLQPSTQTADPGTRAIFNCVSEVVPGLVFTWYFNGRPVNKFHQRFSTKRSGSRLKIYPVIHSDDTGEIKCVASQPDSAYNLTGSATALLWVNIGANPNFHWDTTTEPPLPTTTTISPTTTKPTTVKPATTLPTTISKTTILLTTTVQTTITETTAEKTVTMKSKPVNPTFNKEILCRGDTCNTIPMDEVQTNANQSETKRYFVDPANEIEVNLPSDYQNDFVQPNDIPEPSKHKEVTRSKGSSGLAIGLSLTFLFLSMIIGVGVFWIWRYKFQEKSNKNKGKATEKTKRVNDHKKKQTQILRDNFKKIGFTKSSSKK